MYPGPDAPDLGTFVAQVERALRDRGHEVDLAVLDSRAGGKLRYLGLARRTLRAQRPDVVYAHFLVPSGLIAALGSRAPLVVTAHGRDVRNIGWRPGIRSATRARRAARDDGDLRVRVSAPRARDEAAGGAREDGSRLERRRPRRVHGRARAGRAAALPLRRRARRAQERRAARRRVRASRRGHAHVRRRRPAARAARGTRRRAAPRARAAQRRAGADR